MPSKKKTLYYRSVSIRVSLVDKVEGIVREELKKPVPRFVTPAAFINQAVGEKLEKEMIQPARIVSLIKAK